MPRKTRTHVEENEPQVTAPQRFVPRHLSRQEFANRLYKLMLSRGWHQSELARQSGLTRDAISTYVRGAALPTPTSLQALAKVFRMKPEELLPNQIESAIDADNPSLDIKVSPNAPNKAWLRVNRLVTLNTAVKISELLAADDVISD